MFFSVAFRSDTVLPGLNLSSEGMFGSPVPKRVYTNASAIYNLLIMMTTSGRCLIRQKCSKIAEQSQMKAE